MAKSVIQGMARRTCRPRAEMARALDAFLAEIRAQLQADGEVRIDGFGRFVIKSTGRKVLQDFRTGERIESPGVDKVRFQQFDSVLVGRRSRWHLPAPVPKRPG